MEMEGSPRIELLSTLGWLHVKRLHRHFGLKKGTKKKKKKKKKNKKRRRKEKKRKGGGGKNDKKTNNKKHIRPPSCAGKTDGSVHALGVCELEVAEQRAAPLALVLEFSSGGGNWGKPAKSSWKTLCKFVTIVLTLDKWSSRFGRLE